MWWVQFIHYLILAGEVNYLVQTVMIHECPSRHVASTLTSLEQQLEIKLGDTRPLSGI
jgi:hypothetical protein